MSFDHPAILGDAFQHLALALKGVDKLDCPAAAAHILSALDCLGHLPAASSVTFNLDLSQQVDFSFLDYQTEKIFG